MKKENKISLAGKELVDAIIKAAEEKLAEKIMVFDSKTQQSTADQFIICQGESTVHNRAVADAIIDNLEQQNTHPWHVEGLEDGRWVLVDYSDVVVHIMLPELREFYDLEALWSK